MCDAATAETTLTSPSENPDADEEEDSSTPDVTSEDEVVEDETGFVFWRL